MAVYSRPIYQNCGLAGHFGRDEPEFTWENTDKAIGLKQQLGFNKS
jgi:S-adenosylmethionine synthetase